MIKDFFIRVVACLIAVLALVPASVALLKAAGPMGNRVLLGVPFFKPVIPWIPAFRYPMNTLADYVSSLPCIIALIVFGLGLGVAFRQFKKTPVRRWEDKR